MSRARVEVPQLENMVAAGKKKFVRYAEGAALIPWDCTRFRRLPRKLMRCTK